MLQVTESLLNDCSPNLKHEKEVKYKSAYYLNMKQI